STQLEGHVVIITGGAGGIGAGTTRELVARGANVVVIDIDAAAGRALADDLGEAVVFFEGDVARPDIAKTAVDLAVSTFGKLTGLVNNAHGSTQKLFMDQEPADWELSFGTGFWATVQMMQA